MGVIDNIFAMLLPVILYGILRASSVAIMLCFVNPWMILPIFAAIVFFSWIVKTASIGMTEAQRFDSIFRGPIHQIFTQVVTGLVTVRAYKKMPFFEAKF